jgi:hypothetical protein
MGLMSFPPVNRWPRLAFIAFKFVIVPALFALVIREVFKSAPDFPADFGPRHLLAVALAYQIALFANSLRLRTLIQIYGGALSAGASLRINLMAHLYFFVFMTSIAMEAAPEPVGKHDATDTVIACGSRRSVGRVLITHASLIVLP